MRYIIYSLKTVGGKSVLATDYTKYYRNESELTLMFDFPSGREFVSKFEYTNRRVYVSLKSPKVFMLIANKHLSQDAAFNLLMQYAIGISEIRIDYHRQNDNPERENFWQEVRQKYQNELTAV